MMKKTIKKIIAVVFAAAITVLSPMSVSAVRYTEGKAFEDEYAKLTDYELELIAQMEEDGFTLTDVSCYTDWKTGLYFIDLTFVKDEMEEAKNNPYKGYRPS